MESVVIPSSSWYEDKDLILKLPSGWDLFFSNIADANSVGDRVIEEAFASPIGSPRIAKLARCCSNIAIMVDDLTRPTPAFRVMPFIVKELKEAGVSEEDIKIVMATGAHRPQTRRDLVKKLGKSIVESIEVLNHNPYENLAFLGKTSRGTPIYVNKWVVEADLRIGVGGVYPHEGAGFGGGGKIILPGVAGLDTIERNHLIPGQRGVVEGNANRADIEEAARMARLDVVVNLVINSRREVAGVFVGDMVKAHREGVKEAVKIYKTLVPKKFDVAIVNSYPFRHRAISSC